MKQVRLTIKHNPEDPYDDLRYASKVRRDLWAHSPVEIDPGGPAYQTRRDADQNAYFEFATNYYDELLQTLDKYGHKHRVTISPAVEDVGPPCPNCGEMAGAIFPTVCPHCHVRDISPCPYCKQEVPRQSYVSLHKDCLFRCPACGHLVHFRFNDQPFLPNVNGTAALIVVEEVENTGL